MEFDRNIFTANVKHLLTANGKKSTDLDTFIGKSQGYCYKLLSDANSSSPSIETVAAIADYFGITVTSLLTMHLGLLTGTEKYIINLIDKMKTRTISGSLVWENETPAMLAELEINWNDFSHEYVVYHPLFEPRAGKESFSPVACYHSLFDVTGSYVPVGDIYHASFGESKSFYLAIIDHYQSEASTPEENGPIYELYISHEGIQKVCRSPFKGRDLFGPSLKELYRLISETLTHCMLEEKTRSLIDDFMEEQV